MAAAATETPMGKEDRPRRVDLDSEGQHGDERKRDDQEQRRAGDVDRTFRVVTPYLPPRSPVNLFGDDEVVVGYRCHRAVGVDQDDVADRAFELDAGDPRVAHVADRRGPARTHSRVWRWRHVLAVVCL